MQQCEADVRALTHCRPFPRESRDPPRLVQEEMMYVISMAIFLYVFGNVGQNFRWCLNRGVKQCYREYGWFSVRNGFLEEETRRAKVCYERMRRA